MTVRVIRGTKQQIARELADLPGEVSQAIVLIDEPVARPPHVDSREDPFTEMKDVESTATDVDDAREQIYPPEDR